MQRSFAQSLRLQSRVIGAMMMREVHTRYGRENIGFLWIVGEPLLFAGGVLVLWRMMRGEYERNLAVIPIVLMGYVPLLLFRHTVGRVLYCVRANMGLLYHRRVTLLDIYWARAAVELGGNILAFMVAATLLYMTDLVEWPVDFSMMYLGYFYMAWFTLGVSLCVAALSERSELVEKIWQPISYLMLPISGCYMLAAWLPDEYRQYYLYVPTVSAYEMIRAGYFGDKVQSFWSQPYIAGWSACLTLLGLYLFHRAREHLVVE